MENRRKLSTQCWQHQLIASIDNIKIFTDISELLINYWTHLQKVNQCLLWNTLRRVFKHNIFNFVVINYHKELKV